jgi:hypothetical protein
MSILARAAIDMTSVGVASFGRLLDMVNKGHCIEICLAGFVATFGGSVIGLIVSGETSDTTGDVVDVEESVSSVITDRGDLLT